MLNIKILEEMLHQRLEWCNCYHSQQLKQSYLSQAYGAVELFARLAFDNNQRELEHEALRLWNENYGEKFHKAVYGE